MKIKFTTRQKIIIESLCLKVGDRLRSVLYSLENENLRTSSIEEFCNIVSNELMMEGILPDFEPNSYEIELEALLDVVNRERIKL